MLEGLKAYHKGLAAATFTGQAHAAMSRTKLRQKRDSAREAAEGAGSSEEIYQLTRRADRQACKLQARNIASTLSVPLDLVLGSGRRDRNSEMRLGDSGVLPTGLGLLTAVATLGATAVGGAGGAVLGLLAAHPGKGALYGASAAAATTSSVLGTATWALSQVVALPGAGVKAAANGVGVGMAALYGPRHARRMAAKPTTPA